MIPLQLRLKNFMSYAELDLDFSGVHSAVLCGPNGAGKSTLLDAITYALWDKARGTGEQLIRLGETELWVELVFEIEGRFYRVWRRRTRKSGGQSQLEFHQLKVGEDEYASLTGTTIRETQARLNEAIRMDYETFVNSAFILQGRADQFTTKTPRERKALLGDILGLETYDTLSQRARDRWKAAQARADALESEQQELRTALERRSMLAERRAIVDAALDDVALRLTRAEERLARVHQEEQSLVAVETQRDAAQQRRATAERESAALSSEREHSRAALAEARTRTRQREAIEAAYAEWEGLQSEEQALRKLADACHALEKSAGKLATERQQAAHAHELALRELDGALSALTKEREGFAELLRDRERITKAHAALSEARSAETAHLEKAQKARTWMARLAEIDAAEQKLLLEAAAETKEKQAHLARLQNETRTLPDVEAELKEAQSRLDALAILAVEQERVKEKGFQYRARHEQALAAAEASRVEGRAKAAKLAQLRVNLEVHSGAERLDVRMDVSHACPLCETPLSESELTKICRQYEQEIRGCEDEAVRQEHAAEAIDRDLKQSRARYAELQEQLKTREAETRRVGELSSRLAALGAAKQEAVALEQALAEVAAPALPDKLSKERKSLQDDLAALAYDPAELAVLQARVSDNRWAEARHWALEQALTRQAEIEQQAPTLEADRATRLESWEVASQDFARREQELTAAMTALGYDRAAHQALSARLEALAEAPRNWSELQQQLRTLDTLVAQEATLEAQQAQAALRVAEGDRELLALAHQLERLPLARAELAAAEVEIRHLRSEDGQRREERGRLEAEIQQLDELAERLAEREKEWEAAIADAQTYKELSQAFGKDGIQAIIIENAIPELEEEANRLLARMSDNRMHVRLATQREKKSGGVAETLEIYISDEVGTRNYELYSGGEAFRVNFALRLALSRLLARRAGAKLQTLVIDEGFGTQDEKGRERLVEAINAVSSEFARILVITHIRELKDAFNTQIEVTKRGGVSEVRLVS
ncbi:MAG TPA: SMC family ATPase [Oscillatoriaceae cyanobacterium]